MIAPDFVTIRRILMTDLTWSAYALADLQPAFAPYTQWSIGQSVQGEGLTLLFTVLTPPILVTVGPAEAIRAALAQTDLPAEVFISAREEHYAPIAEFYDFADRIHPMWRMIPTDPSKVQFPSRGDLVRLKVEDGERLKKLYSYGGEFAPDFFDPYQLQDGVYFGIIGEDGALVASGGTHILERESGVAAIGNIYTRPDQRGQGHASAVFQAIVTTLRTEKFTNIFLNVNQRNGAARKIYERYGFTVYCPFLEGEGVRRKA
ncbi:MAG: GNAT family N-acetyltransferase [Chloroflexi bacterium]|nr:GNAT family N-acetyltransferase [Chloroflexota bacterium]